MNALPEQTEQDDMNALPFDYRMTRISISTELNAWIVSSPLSNIGIETHNDLVQMLEDANEANIALEAQQTSLQEEVRDKNVVIRHLKSSAWGRSESPAFEGRTAKSTKLPDPPLFEGPSQDVDNWLSRMRNKLKANKDHFPTEELKIAYRKPSWWSRGQAHSFTHAGYIIEPVSRRRRSTIGH